MDPFRRLPVQGLIIGTKMGVGKHPLDPFERKMPQTMKDYAYHVYQDYLTGTATFRGFKRLFKITTNLGTTNCVNVLWPLTQAESGHRPGFGFEEP